MKITDLKYDAASGKLYWNKEGHAWNGKEAGTLNPRGYLRIKINYKNLLVHRVVWLLYYGTWPKCVIDHINGLKTDNRIENLRDVTNKENSNNSYKHRDGRTPGVNFCKTRRSYKKWVANYFENKKKFQIGYFETEQEAIEALKKYTVSKNCHTV